MFTAYGDKRLLSDAIAAGARGYVMKGSPPADLLRAIRTVADGQGVRRPVALARAADDRRDTAAEQPLSEREREILQLLAEGFHTEEVARRIGLSVETVKSDTKRVIAKLQADTRTHAVAIALRRDLDRLTGVSELPRFWIVMQILIVICVLISAVIAIVRLSA